jgi:tRNA(fMet)-specific endonuclease VapC
MIVLDTDHVVVLSAAGPRGERLKARLKSSPDPDIAITIISVEEQMRGWLAEIRRRHEPIRQVEPYDRLNQLVAFWNLCRILPFDRAAASRFQLLRRQVRIGAQDLKIATVALVWNAKLLTGNTRDFERVPGLRIEDWLD